MKKELIRTERYIHIFDEAGKQLAHLPLNDSPILEGVLLLPPLEQEDDVEKLAEEEYPIIPNTSPNVNWDRANKQEGFERGYNKAREKYKFTEEHAKYLFECGRNFQVNADITFTVAREHLSQPKTPTHFEFEMDCTLVGLDIESECTLRTTTNSQGQQVACGKYIY